MNIRIHTIVTLFLLLSCLNGYADNPDYRGMVDRIGVLFKESLDHYRQRETELAKGKVQDAYFQVFENLEGPIRINVSAKKNYELEAEFGDIRKQIMRGEPIEAIKSRVDWLMDELNKVLPELEGGVVLVAEGTEGDPEPQPAPVSTQEPALESIEPTWRHALNQIRSHLNTAVISYREGNGKQAREQILQAQFQGYKNTLLETAVRRYVSHTKDAENNSGFSSMIHLVKNDKGVAALNSAADQLLQSLQTDLPGLPLVDGAKVVEIDEEQADVDWKQVSTKILDALQDAVQTYRDSDSVAASTVQDIYFDVFEASGMESAIAARDATLKAELESYFARIVGQMKNGAPVEEIDATLDSMRGEFQQAQELLGVGGESPWVLFLYSLLIILREGFEAILVVTALIAYLVKTNHQDKLRVIYNSVWVALGLSLLTAVLLEWVFKASAASQEILEGITMLIAAAVLFSISYWLISKAEAQKWMAYIKCKVEGSLTTGSLTGLWFASFLAVYREGAETVLFYKALTVGVGTSGNLAILAGFVIGCVLLIAIYWIMRHGAVRLPLRVFFMATGALLYFMAFVFVGKGVMELIEGKLFEPALIDWMPQLSMIGIYPYWQSLIPQLILILAAVAAGMLFIRKGKMIEAQK